MHKQLATAVQDMTGRITPKQLAPNLIKTGVWQKEKSAGPGHDRLFLNVLVAITEDDGGRQALEQSLEIARRERGQLRGLHAVASEKERLNITSQFLQGEFTVKCRVAGIEGKLSIETGQPADKLCERSTLADIVVAPLLKSPGTNLITRLNSGFRTLVRRSACPVLAVPDQPSHFTKALLIYDGSPKAKEALFVAAYLAGQWQMPLVVLTVVEEKMTDRSIEAEVSAYLEKHGVQPSFIRKKGAVTKAILDIAEEQAADLIITGGYSRSPVQGLLLGDSVDELLSRTKQPVLICR
ncbi:MAG: universal stress protein [Anaerolineae bacterium]|nr:universal stress protein [Anaerolineae bacterium]